MQELDFTFCPCPLLPRATESLGHLSQNSFISLGWADLICRFTYAAMGRRQGSGGETPAL